MANEEELLIGTGSRSHNGRWRLIFAVFSIAVIGLLFGLLGWQIHMTRALQREIKQQNQQPVANSPYAFLQPEISQTMDTSADPCNDFYQYSCGGFIAQYPEPLPFAYTPVFSIITENNLDVLNGIVTNQWPLIGDLYASCMSSSPAEFPGDEFFAAMINLVAQKISPLQSTQVNDVLPVLASLHSIGSDAFFTPEASQNLFSSDSNMYLSLMESGFPEFYTNTSVYSEFKVIGTVLEAVGVTKNVSHRAEQVLEIELALFSIAGEAETLQEAYINVSVAFFEAWANVSYSPYYTAILDKDLLPTDTLILTIPSYFAAANLTTVLNTVTLQALQDYLTYRTFISVYSEIANGAQGLISTKFKEIEFLPSYETKHKNPHQIKPKPIIDMEPILKNIALTSATYNNDQLACINIVNTFLPDFVGLIFTLEVIDSDVVSDIHLLTANIQNAFKNSLTGLDWIDQFSQDAASYKLDKILQIIGHPNFLQRYRGLVLNPGAGITSNVIAIKQQVFYDKISVVGSEFNRSNYEFPSTIVNAFYSPPTNTINFPAGILQPPMYSLNYPPMLRYARLGYVIGHETTHGFDNNGRLWSAYGVYSDLGIFDNQSAVAFEEQTQCLINQFDKFQVAPGYFVNGVQTLGENIADLGGIKNAYRGYKAWVAQYGAATDALDQPSIVQGLNNEQLFWVMLGQTWCSVASDAQLIAQTIRDVHSPAKFRINGPLANFNEFANAFQCKANAPMNPTNKCLVW